jgi:hypothetical protein
MQSWMVRGGVLAAVIVGSLSGCWSPGGWLLLAVGGQPVRCHPEAVIRGAAHHDVIDRAVRAGQGKMFGDLGWDAAIRARYDGLHCATSGCMSRDDGQWPA